MSLAQVRVALNRLQSLVPEHFRDFCQACAVHGKVRCSTVAKIVKLEILNVGLF